MLLTCVPLTITVWPTCCSRSAPPARFIDLPVSSLRSVKAPPDLLRQPVCSTVDVVGDCGDCDGAGAVKNPRVNAKQLIVVLFVSRIRCYVDCWVTAAVTGR